MIVSVAFKLETKRTAADGTEVINISNPFGVKKLPSEVRYDNRISHR
jgi:hypothetical protein